MNPSNLVRPGAMSAAILLGIAAGSARGQEAPAGPVWAGGGGALLESSGPHVSDAERTRIWTMIEENEARLRAEGILPPPGERPSILTPPLLDWPLRNAAGLLDTNFHVTANFLDQNAAYPNQLLDWNCGARTYDTGSGYNHSGIDISSWPFGWRRMSLGQVVIVAAAPGVITAKDDGNPDQSCSCAGTPWNAVYVRHADNSIAWYGHMKTGSLTWKPVGASVGAGEYLGTVGSSGCSSGPHLHFELYDSANALQEPYSGACNSKNAFSWWRNQRPYDDSAVNKLVAGTTSPSIPACPGIESPNETTIFPRNSSIFFSAFYREQPAGVATTYRIRKSDGSVYYSWNHAAGQFYQASWYTWNFAGIGNGGPDGIWKFEADFGGRTTIRTFNIGGTPAGRVPGDAAAETPLMATKGVAGAVGLSFGASCLGTDTNYAVYEGAIGSFSSHTGLLCSTGGSRTPTVTPTLANAYFLVVATNGTKDGSYGTSSAGVERAPAASPCRAQELGSCP